MNPTEPVKKLCQDCGATFECGMGAATPCWCSQEHPPVMPLPGAGADCYCANCLKARIELQRASTQR